MPWAKNGPRCPYCGSPISRRIPLVRLKRKVNKQKHLSVIYLANPQVRVRTDSREEKVVRCRLCTTYVEYLSRGGRRYFPWQGRQKIAPVSLALLGKEATERVNALLGLKVQISPAQLLAWAEGVGSFEEFFQKWFEFVRPHLSALDGKVRWESLFIPKRREEK